VPLVNRSIVYACDDFHKKKIGNFKSIILKIILLHEKEFQICHMKRKYYMLFKISNKQI